VKVVVDRNLCEATGMCAGIAPELFEPDEEGVARVLVKDPGEELRSIAELAVRSCPVGALSIQSAGAD
jgi:ferredoxin